MDIQDYDSIIARLKSIRSLESDYALRWALESFYKDLEKERDELDVALEEEFLADVWK